MAKGNQRWLAEIEDARLALLFLAHSLTHCADRRRRKNKGVCSTCSIKEGISLTISPLSLPLSLSFSASVLQPEQSGAKNVPLLPTLLPFVSVYPPLLHTVYYYRKWAVISMISWLSEGNHGTLTENFDERDGPVWSLRR